MFQGFCLFHKTLRLVEGVGQSVTGLQVTNSFNDILELLQSLKHGLALVVSFQSFLVLLSPVELGSSAVQTLHNFSGKFSLIR